MTILKPAPASSPIPISLMFLNREKEGSLMVLNREKEGSPLLRKKIFDQSCPKWGKKHFWSPNFFFGFPIGPNDIINLEYQVRSVRASRARHLKQVIKSAIWIRFWSSKGRFYMIFGLPTRSWGHIVDIGWLAGCIVHFWGRDVGWTQPQTVGDGW